MTYEKDGVQNSPSVRIGTYNVRVSKNDENDSNNYLTKKVGEIAKAGANVIFERGLWSAPMVKMAVKKGIMQTSELILKTSCLPHIPE